MAFNHSFLFSYDITLLKYYGSPNQHILIRKIFGGSLVRSGEPH
jgi:hypothetical protein